MTSPRFVTANGRTTMCLAHSGDQSIETCFAFSPTAAPDVVRAVPKVAKQKLARVKRKAGAWSVCLGGTCKPVGKKLAKELTAAAANEDLRASDDGKVVVFGSAVWAVPEDKALVLEPPKEYGANEVNRPALVNVELIGRAIVASWYTCAGPCGQSILVDTNGANRGDWFGAGVVFPLDAKRLAVMAIESANGFGAEFIVIDLASAKQTSRLSIDARDVTLVGAAKLDNRSAVVGFSTETGWTVQILAAPVGKPVTAIATYAIPACRS